MHQMRLMNKTENYNISEIKWNINIYIEESAEFTNMTKKPFSDFLKLSLMPFITSIRNSLL